jgi:hypothetical protein
VAGMPELVPPFPHLVVGRQETVHRSLRAEIPALIKQRGVDFGWGKVHEPRLVEHRKHGGLLFRAECAGRGSTR